MWNRTSNRFSARGFTLVEMIMVIVITGIIGGMVAIFLQAPVRQYTDVARRAELTDIADTAFHRLLRDIRTSVPNSVRLPTPAGSSYIEFLPTKAGGRYRAVAGAGTLCDLVAGNTNGDALSFSAADSCFEIIGPQVNFAATDHIVIGSTQWNQAPTSPYDTTAGTGVLRAYTGAVGASSIVRMTATQLPASAELPSQRFQVVDGAQQGVTYACVGTLNTLDANGNGQARLMRYWGYGFRVAQAAPPIAGGQAAILAENISDCNFVYDIVNQRNGLVAITLRITQANETVSLYEEVHVNNAP